MERKGLGSLKPWDVDKLDDIPCWYFYDELPEGKLELEVFWSPEDGWRTMVTTFNRASSFDTYTIGGTSRIQPNILPLVSSTFLDLR
jgi:hypothetical protein